MTNLRSRILKNRNTNTVKEVKYCKSCVYPSTKPNLFFNNEGICSACTSFAERKNIDWGKRESDFHQLLEKFKKPGNYDCIIPVSGGKDSFYQTWLLKKLGYNPLLVTATTDSLSDIGMKNIETMRLLGADHIEYTLNKKVRRRINKYQLMNIGDISWPEHVAMWTLPARVSVSMNVPLLIWGENGQNEYGGPASEATKRTLDSKWVEEFGGLNGFRVKDLLQYDDVEEKDLIGYTYPSDEDINRVGTTGLYLGYYFQWDGWRNAFMASNFGFASLSNVVEGSAANYENLDNYQTGIHDYFKYLKYGFGRATDIVNNHLRRGRINRKEAIEIINEKDGEFPSSCLNRPLQEILDEIDMTIEEFNETCDKFTNRSIFKVDLDGKLIKEKSGKPILKIKVQ